MRSRLLLLIIASVVSLALVGANCLDDVDRQGTREGSDASVTATDSIPNRTWKRSGNALWCRVTEKDSTFKSLMERIPEREMCQHIGPFQLGLPFSEQTDQLPEPARRLLDTETEKMYAYSLKPEEGSTGYPFIVLGSVRDTLTLIQLTGPEIDSTYEFGFSMVELGDSVEAVTDAFGVPGEKSEVEGMEGVTLWSYDPYPISLEMRDERLFSIRIWMKGKGPALN